MRTSIRTVITTTALLGLALPLAACGSPEDDVSQPGVSSDAEDTTDAATDEPTTDATDDANGDDATGDDASAGGTDDGPNAGAYAAIDLAEAQAGGTAFELDRDDDGEGHWEVSVAVGGAEINAYVDLAGTEVLRTESDGTVSREEAAALERAEVSMAEAIRIAVDEVDGIVEEADLDEERGTVAWEVVMADDTEVYVDVVTGEVLEVERD